MLTCWYECIHYHHGGLEVCIDLATIKNCSECTISMDVSVGTIKVTYA